MITPFEHRLCFLLKMEPIVRVRMLGRLCQVQREPDALPVVKVQGNSPPPRHPASLWRPYCARSRPNGKRLAEMSPAEARGGLHRVLEKALTRAGIIPDNQLIKNLFHSLGEAKVGWPDVLAIFCSSSFSLMPSA
jgi:hypothetical protein